MIKIIDYGIGNLQAFITAYKRLGINIQKATTIDEIETATSLILPGVGSFDHAMDLLNNSGLRDSLDHLVLEKKVPIIGICVGMQMLATKSEEGKLPGLGWIAGKVKLLPSHYNLPLPHMGWNNLNIKTNNPLINHNADENKNNLFYFLHSYYFEPINSQHIIATVEYGIEFPCIIGYDNIWGIQCHPEKSHQAGSNLLQKFAEI
ncbi:glutamine amidotransferase [Providencia alcalifaciens]|uniref:Imidazole glycerol phosphate synthase subunit HisH n=1 Tax=Providencia alcalifaciens TaxID=126385 RepID=A0A4R3NEI6_9GAMM|nr:imidazole glycerol phosphate synthase subunit HisH [Providencia alcalifaciens]TCT30365.1 glutamine amidotransferase [Providencia alcalifaciens]